MTAVRTMADLERENAYLKLRLARADLDIVDLTAEVGRLGEDRERLHARRAARTPNPLGDGQ